MGKEIIIRILLLAVVGGIIGYSTNVIAVKMLFKPLNPIRIPIIGYEIVGLIPKRKSEIAYNIGKAVGEELVDYDAIIENLIVEDDKDRLKEYAKARLQVIINEKISFIPSMFKPMIFSSIDEIVESELDRGLDSLMELAKDKAKSRIDIAKMVEEKINELDLIELENMIINLSKKELTHIENLGLLLGFIIGIVQGLITVFI
ncbi:DUF445 domain-containing protein [Peptostreptococcus equinus]|uniref:DUF445 family protein n=1 Tax=Peptostreptococcus equinus TaxID=3003601 RepID=A0ABY7JU36_9FIRM|nr:DUF445 family protein [Peptostreptococcus sp. CBA3647]WAW15480.1 DUF445 family protein [Peptostreptococcus sp. CBA3647]